MEQKYWIVIIEHIIKITKAFEMEEGNCCVQAESGSGTVYYYSQLASSCTVSVGFYNDQHQYDLQRSTGRYD